MDKQIHRNIKPYQPQTSHGPVLQYNSPNDTKYTHRINTLRPRQNGCHFADDTFKHIFLNEDVWISIEIPLKFVPKGPINNISALVKGRRQAIIWTNDG